MSSKLELTPIAVDVHGASRITGYPVPTLNGWRSRGGGPPFVRANRTIRYLVEDLHAFMRAHVVASTAEVAANAANRPEPQPQEPGSQTTTVQDSATNVARPRARARRSRDKGLGSTPPRARARRSRDKGSERCLAADDGLDQRDPAADDGLDQRDPAADV